MSAESVAADVPATGPDASFAVVLQGITKRYPGVVANYDINIAVRRGHVHAIVGENGAGKSTLMKTLYGMHKPDEGDIEIDGKPAHLSSPADAIRAGIGMVHQHFMLADNLTVLENIILGAEPTNAGLLDKPAARRKIMQISDAYGLGIRPDVLVEALGVGDRQRVEICKVLYRGARILILDEPTAVLVPHEVDELFDNLRGLKAEGLTVLFISHKLDEVLAVADEITVIRRGTTVATVDPKETTARKLAELMVGSELPVPELRESTVTDVVQLDVQGLTVTDLDGRALLDGVTFAIHKGEIVGIGGVEGNGQAELVEAILGLRPISGGRLLLGGADMTQWNTRRRRTSGIAYIPEDRHRQGLLLEAPLWENRILGHQTERPNARGPLIDVAAAKRDTARIVEAYDVRTPGIDVTAGSLSGGNQQKLIVGREMSGTPVVLIASHPTRGVDVGAQAAIWDHLRAARAGGLAVLLISADLDELIGMSDTLHVILRGRLVATVDPHTVTPADLGAAMTGADSSAAADSGEQGQGAVT
ncbi:MAG TPA: ABC transporter ATP-binding protein [Jatrophihabitantaceae bacterium]|nr:ABC transporter ATP-binding protein [Jatrophihabitantaceae bacterium]